MYFIKGKSEYLNKILEKLESNSYDESRQRTALERFQSNVVEKNKDFYLLRKHSNGTLECIISISLTSSSHHIG